MANNGSSSIKPIYVPKPIYEEKGSSDTNPFAHFTDDSNATFNRDNASQHDSQEDSPLPEAPSIAKDKKSKKIKGAKSFKFGWGKKKKSQDKLIDEDDDVEDVTQEFASFQGTHNPTHSTEGTGGEDHNNTNAANPFNAEYGGFDDDDASSESTTSAAVVKGSKASVVIESDPNQQGQESPYGVIKQLGSATTPTQGYNPHHEPAEEESEGAYGEIKPFENSSAPNATSLASALTFHVKEEDSLYTEMVPDADVVAKEAALDQRHRHMLTRKSVSTSSLTVGSNDSSLAPSPNRSPSFSNDRKSIIQDRDLPGVPTNIKKKGGISRNVGRRGTMAPHAMIMKKTQVRGTGSADDEESDIAKGYVEGMDHLTVQDYVLGSMPGDYLVRNSSSSKNLVLCVNDRRRLANYKIESLPKGEYKFYGRNFSDLDHVIEFASLNLKSLVKAAERLVLQNPATVEKWFVGETEKARVEGAVAAGEHGQFLVRKSSSYTSFVVCVNDQGSIGNFLIEVDKQTGGYLFGNFKFKSLRKTIGWFQSSPIKGPKTQQLTITTPVELEWTNIDNLDAYDL